jgi:hypothetical protein
VTDSGWLCLIADAQAAGTSLHTLLTDDLDAFIAALPERGIDPGPIEPVTTGVRQSIVTDPDGNRLKVGQVEASGVAR